MQLFLVLDPCCSW